MSKQTIQVLVFGGTGAGKTSVAHAIKRALERFDIDATVRDEPFDTVPSDYTLNRSLEAMSEKDTRVHISTATLQKSSIKDTKKESTFKIELTDEDILAIADPWTPLGS